MHTGSQMQAIATTNAKAEMKMEGRKYGNLQEDLCFHNDNQLIKNKDRRITKLLNFLKLKITYLSQKESFGNICGYFTVGCKVLEKQAKMC
jgi:predicted class III extradiol MEMO1 family dioxygenase